MISCIVCSITNYGIRACGPIIFVALCGFVIYLLVRWVCKNNDIRLSDENLEKDLDAYLKTDKPDFAVLITGSWGIGKTYFIKQYMRKKKNLMGIFAPVYVSLYGIKDEKQLEIELMKKSFFSFGSIIFIFMVILLSALITWLAFRFFPRASRIDFFQFWWPILLSVYFLVYKLFKLYILDILLWKRAVVFDDLERILANPETILAHINRLVEHLHKPVIVIGNEEAIQIKDYPKIKEKMFGKTFAFSPATEDIISDFISPKHTPLLHELINQESFDWFYERSVVKKCPINLRVFQHVITEFERTFQRVDRNKLFDKAIIKHLIPDFFCILHSFECPEFPNGHSLKPSELQKMPNPWDEVETKDWLKQYFPYAFRNHPHSILPPDCWKAVLQHKNLPGQRIDEHWEFLIHGGPRLFARSFSMHLTSDKALYEFFQELKKQMRKKTLCNPYEILCIVGNLLYLFGSSSDKIQRQAKIYIDLLGKTNSFSEDFLDLNEINKFNSNSEILYESFQIPNKENAVVISLKNHLKEKLYAFYIHNRKTIFDQYLQQLKNYDDELNLEWWVKHSEVDLFSNLGENAPKLLFDALMALSEKDLCYQLSRLRSHFGKIDDQDFDDVSFWTRFNEIARAQITEWNAENKMIGKKHSLNAFCDSVDIYCKRRANRTSNKPEKDSEQ